ncbi:hypothetical protein WCE37_05425 [Luteimonas sp. MJ250]|uniref:hypothetical protein n=1 Tax=Luteimonas sp. MJ250 TaxID=3129236 RepID=UPI0031BA672F
MIAALLPLLSATALAGTPLPNASHVVVQGENSLNSMQSHGYGNTTRDRIEVTGSRIDSGRYLQPTIDFTERVSAVFEIKR